MPAKRNLDEIRQQQIEKLELARNKAEQVMLNPPKAFSSSGKTIPDPETGEFILDEGARIRAAEAHRKTTDSLWKALGIDQADTANVMLATIWAELEALREVVSEAARLRRENAELLIENARLRGEPIVIEHAKLLAGEYRQLGY